MIRHILRKDLRLLWPFAVALAIVPFVLVTVNAFLGRFHSEDPALDSLRLLLEVVFYFGSGCLILMIVHQDSLVGVRQDWLVRPIRRSDLLVAKLILVLGVVQVPLLAACVAEGIADGFAAGHALAPALSENLWLLLAFTLPVFAIAALTRSLTEAIATAVALFLIDLCWAMLLKGSTGSPLGPTGNTVIAWIPGAVQLLISFVARLWLLGSSISSVRAGCTNRARDRFTRVHDRRGDSLAGGVPPRGGNVEDAPGCEYGNDFLRRSARTLSIASWSGNAAISWSGAQYG